MIAARLSAVSSSIVLALALTLALIACAPQARPAPAPDTDESGAGAEASRSDEASATSTDAAGPSDPRDRAILEAHNARRAEHCALPLAWSHELAGVAQSWADELARRGCAFEHNDSAYGENLAAGTAGTLSPDDVVEMWHRESARYHYRTGRFGMDTGHFTQLVWVGTQRVGCGTTTCNGLDVWVCNYDPPGNVEGMFRENVLPTSCR